MQSTYQCQLLNTQITEDKHTPSHRTAWSTSKGYFISPSTRPGVSTKVTKLKRFCREVQISVPRYSETPEIKRKLRFRQIYAHLQCKPISL